MQEAWAFLFSSLGAFIALLSVAVIVGIALLLWWTRKID
jgi:hypothetical protein